MGGWVSGWGKNLDVEMKEMERGHRVWQQIGMKEVRLKGKSIPEREREKWEKVFRIHQSSTNEDVIRSGKD